MPTVIGFLWPWAINTVFPFFPLLMLISKLQDIGCSSFTYLLHWTQIWRVIDVELASWIFSGPLLWKRRGGGCSTSVYFWLKLKRTELWVFPTYFLFHAGLNQLAQVLRRFQHIIDIDKSFTSKSHDIVFLVGWKSAIHKNSSTF